VPKLSLRLLRIGRVWAISDLLQSQIFLVFLDWEFPGRARIQDHVSTTFSVVPVRQAQGRLYGTRLAFPRRIPGLKSETWGTLRVSRSESVWAAPRAVPSRRLRFPLRPWPTWGGSVRPKRPMRPKGSFSTIYEVYLCSLASYMLPLETWMTRSYWRWRATSEL
jgi:hypothetical protein